MKKNRITLSIIFVLLFLCMVISISYAFYVSYPTTKYSVTSNVSVPSCLGINLNQGTSITLTGDYSAPVRDNMVLNSSSNTLANYKHSFAVTNNCASSTNISIAIATLNGSTLPASSLRYIIVDKDVPIKGKTSDVKYLNETSINFSNQVISDLNKSSINVSSGYLIKSDTINANTTKNYDLYIWVDYNEGNLENNATVDKTFNGTLVIADVLS